MFKSRARNSRAAVSRRRDETERHWRSSKSSARELEERVEQRVDAVLALLGRGVLARVVADALVLARDEDHRSGTQRGELLRVVARAADDALVGEPGRVDLPGDDGLDALVERNPRR